MDAVAPHQFKCQGTFTGHGGPVWSLANSGSMLYSGSADCTIKVWELTSFPYRCVATLQEKGVVHALCTCNNRLYSGSADCSIKEWDTDSMQLVRSVEAHSAEVCTLFVANGYIFSGSMKEVKVYDLATLTLKKVLTGFNHWVRAMCVFGNQLYAGSNNMIMVFNIETFEHVHTIPCTNGSVYALTVWDLKLLSGHHDNIIHVRIISNMLTHRYMTYKMGTSILDN